MRNIKLLFAIVCMALINGCAPLKPVSISMLDAMENYKYFYIIPVGDVTSSAGNIYGGSNGLYGASHTVSINPSDVIAGYMLKQGYTRVPEVSQSNIDETLIISYGESGRRNRGLGYTIEVTIQFVSAKNNKPICVCTGEGQGSSEADDVRIAINRCLDGVFIRK